MPSRRSSEPSLSPASTLTLDDASFLSPPVNRDAIDGLRPCLDPLLQRLETWWREGRGDNYLGLARQSGELEKAITWSHRIRGRANRLVVFGIGGSSLGAEMLIHALAGDGLPVSFHDNVDPESLASLALLDWRECFLLVVSKSGATAETLMQFLSTLPLLEAQLGKHLSERVAVITENLEGDLARIADDLELPIIPHPPVGGRFSVMSVVGLLPAAVAGVDVAGVWQGAAAMGARCCLGEMDDNPGLRLGAAQYLHAREGRPLSVMMSYGDRLHRVSAWFAQLWGESLGKRSAGGDRLGLTPISARGVTDQHSQLQLYLDGPADKQFTLLYDTALAREGRLVPERFRELAAVHPLVGRGSGELFAAEFMGTRDTLIHCGAPVRTLAMAGRQPGALGELIMLLETETVVVAELLGVNAFDQPAVEEGKRRARAYLESSPRRSHGEVA